MPNLIVSLQTVTGSDAHFEITFPFHLQFPKSPFIVPKGHGRLPQKQMEDYLKKDRRTYIGIIKKIILIWL
jgi:hypothetical protein